MMISAVAREPLQGLNQFRRQLHAAGIDLKAALENLAAAGDHVKKTTGRLHIEDITPFIFYFFKTAAPALLAATVPIGIFGREVGHRLFFTPLGSCPHHLSQRPHPLGSIISLPTKFSHCGLFLCGSTGRTGQSKRDATIAAVDTLNFDFDLFPFLDYLAGMVDPLA